MSRAKFNDQVTADHPERPLDVKRVQEIRDTFAKVPDKAVCAADVKMDRIIMGVRSIATLAERAEELDGHDQYDMLVAIQELARGQADDLARMAHYLLGNMSGTSVGPWN